MKYYAMGNQKEALKALQQVTEAVDEMEAEIVQQAKEIEQLRTERDEIERLRKERDEARREVCRLMSMFNAENSVEITASRSWDCFKEETP